MGTYSIVERIAHAKKFTCMVSFNGNPAEYHEVESLDPKEIDMCLQASADQSETQVVAQEKIASLQPEIVLEGGKIVVPPSESVMPN